VIARVYHVDRSYSFLPDHQQARNQEAAGGEAPPAKFFAPLEKCVGHFLKLLDTV